MYVRVLPWCLHGSSFGKFSSNVSVKLVKIDHAVREGRPVCYIR